MQRHLERDPSRRSLAFTLTELLVTLVVLGVLAGLLGVTLQGVSVRSRDAALEAELIALGNGVAALAAFDQQLTVATLRDFLDQEPSAADVLASAGASSRWRAYNDASTVPAGDVPVLKVFAVDGYLGAATVVPHRPGAIAYLAVGSSGSVAKVGSNDSGVWTLSGAAALCFFGLADTCGVGQQPPLPEADGESDDPVGGPVVGDPGDSDDPGAPGDEEPGSPTAPTIVSTSRGNLSLTVNFVVTSTEIAPVTSVEAILDGVEVATLSPAATSYIFDGLTAGVTYNLAIRATNQTGDATASTTATAITVPAQVNGLTVSSSSSTSLVLNWNPVASSAAAPVSGYTVQRLNGSEWVSLTNVDGATTSWTNAGLTTGVTYTYRVRGYNDAGLGNASTAISGTPVAASGPSLVGSWSRDMRQGGCASNDTPIIANLPVSTAQTWVVTVGVKDTAAGVTSISGGSGATFTQVLRSSNGTSSATEVWIGRNTTGSGAADISICLAPKAHVSAVATLWNGLNGATVTSAATSGASTSPTMPGVSVPSTGHSVAIAGASWNHTAAAGAATNGFTWASGANTSSGPGGDTAHVRTEMAYRINPGAGTHTTSFSGLGTTSVAWTSIGVVLNVAP
jgi:prepilin-type N-terminal cleavage/methylation domain-containing protein